MFPVTKVRKNNKRDVVLGGENFNYHNYPVETFWAVLFDRRYKILHLSTQSTSEPVLYFVGKVTKCRLQEESAQSGWYLFPPKHIHS